MAASIHDATFKQLISDRDFFVGFCHNYLPAEYLDALDFKTAEIVKLSGEGVHQSINPEKESKTEIADVLYSIKYKHEDRYVMVLVHIEHFTNPPKHAVLRVTNYGFNALAEWAELNPGEPLPTIVPIIYVHGRKPFSHTLDVYRLFDEPTRAKYHLENPLLVDLTQLSDEELVGHKVISGAEIMLKHAFDKGGLVSDHTLDLMLSHLGQLSDKATLVVLKYMLNRLEGNVDRAVGRYIELNPDKEDIAMTMMQHLEESIAKKTLDEHAPNLIAQGKLEGKLEGANERSLEIAKSMLLAGEDENKVAAYTGLAFDVIAKIKDSITH